MSSRNQETPAFFAFLGLLWKVYTGYSGHECDHRRPGGCSAHRPLEHRVALRWHHLPRYARAGAALVVTTVAYGLVVARTFTLILLAVLFAAGTVLGAWQCVYLVRNWRHMRHCVRPLERTLMRGIPAAPDVLEITRGKRDRDVIEGVVIEWPADTEITTADQDYVLQSVTTRLPIEAPGVAWRLKGRSRMVTFTPSEPPPVRVTLRDMRPAIEGSGPSQIIAGLGRRNVAVPIDLHSDSPHIALSIGSGGGKTITARGHAIQVLRKGGIVVILNAKRTGYNWTRGLPNVAHCKTVGEIASMLMWLNTERERREDVAEVTGDIEDEVHGDVGPRIFVIFEEQNLTVPKIKKTDPEAFDALGDFLFAGRAARMNMEAIAQRYSAKAAGGGDVRATVNSRILGRYEKSAWKMLAEQFPMPAPSNTPGRVQVVTDQVMEAQTPYITGQEAHDYALSGQVAICPGDMPARCAIGAAVPAGQLEKTGPEQHKSSLDRAIPQVLSAPRLMGLSEACSEGVIDLTLAAARKRRQRDEASFPPPRGQRGAELLYAETELMQWEETR